MNVLYYSILFCEKTLSKYIIILHNMCRVDRPQRAFETDKRILFQNNRQSIAMKT